MAITYTGTNGLFTKGGKVVKAVNARAATAATDLPAELASLFAPFDAGGREDQVAAAFAAYDGFKDGQMRVRQTVAAYFDAVLTDRAEVLDQLGLLRGGVGQADFWEAFLRQMTADAQTVQKSVVGVGSVTAAGTNTGTGTVLVTPLLDGYNAPLRGRPALRAYAGLTSQLACAETMRFECTRDAGTGAAAGKESLSWQGGTAYGAFDWRGEGSGQGPGLDLAGDGGLVNDGDFEQFSTNTPSQWTIAAGTAGTHVFQDLATFYRGLSALKLTGDGALAAVTLTQAVASRLNPLRMYCLSLRLKADATIAAGDLTVSLAGTGYSPGGTETISVAHGSLPTSFTLKNCFILTPSSIPSDMTVKILWNGTPTNAKSIWIDSLSLAPAVYHGGLGAVAVPGAVDCIRGDRWTSAITQDGAGTFQEFARKWWGVQLRSANSGSETLANSLAT